MGKMLNVLMMIFVIELAVGLFITGFIDSPEQTSFLDLLRNPENWSLSSFLSVINSSVFLIGGSTAITVGTLWMKSEFLVYGGISFVFLGFASTLFNLHQQISNIPFIAGNIGSTIATIFLGGIFVYFLITILDFARGRD